MGLVCLSCAREHPSSFIMQSQSSPQTQCDFSPFIKIAGDLYLHRREKAIFYVSPELLKIAKEASELLSDHIGIDLFEMRDARDYEDQSLNDGSIIYIESDESHYEKMKNSLEPGDYLAYCKTRQKYNIETGEMYYSDIVFNPIIYDKKRAEYKQAKRRTNDIMDSKRDRLEDVDEHEICQQVWGLNPPQSCYEKVRERKREREDLLDDYEDKFDDLFDGWKKNIYRDTLKTMIHELGHALGYKHTLKDIKNIMYKSNATGGTILTGRQVNAVRCVFGLPSHDFL